MFILVPLCLRPLFLLCIFGTWKLEILDFDTDSLCYNWIGQRHAILRFNDVIYWLGMQVFVAVENNGYFLKINEYVPKDPYNISRRLSKTAWLCNISCQLGSYNCLLTTVSRQLSQLHWKLPWQLSRFLTAWQLFLSAWQLFLSRQLS